MVGHCDLPEPGINITVQEFALELSLQLLLLGQFGHDDSLADFLVQEFPAELLYRRLRCIPNATVVNFFNVLEISTKCCTTTKSLACHALSIPRMDQNRCLFSVMFLNLDLIGVQDIGKKITSIQILKTGSSSCVS